MGSFFAIQRLAARQVCRERGYAVTLAILFAVSIVCICAFETTAKQIYGPIGYDE